MRATVVVLVLLAALGLMLDRGAELLAERVAADHARSRLDLAATPDIEVDGFPFLSQVVTGRFDQVRATATGVPLRRLHAGRVELTARRLDVDARHPLASRAASVDAELAVTYAEVGRLAPEGMRVGYVGPGRVRVAAPLAVPGREVEAVSTSSVRLVGQDVVVRAESIRVNGTPLEDTGLAPRVRGRLDFTLRVDDLPGGLDVTEVRTRRDGLRVRAHGAEVDLARLAAIWR